MKTTFVRSALAAITLIGLSVTLAATPADPPSVGAFKWVQALNQAERGFYLEDSVLRTLPAEYRNALLASILPGAARAEFWRAALAGYRDTHSMPSAQVEALNRAIRHAESLDGSIGSLEASRGLVAELYDALGPAAARDLLYRSDVPLAAGSPLPTAELLVYRWRQVHATLATKLGTARKDPPCNCVTVAECGPETEWTCSDSPSCGTVSGCGSSCVDYCLPKGQPQ
jgi:hypothetical protein